MSDTFATASAEFLPKSYKSDPKHDKSQQQNKLK